MIRGRGRGRGRGGPNKPPRGRGWGRPRGSSWNRTPGYHANQSADYNRASSESNQTYDNHNPNLSSLSDRCPADQYNRGSANFDNASEDTMRTHQYQTSSDEVPRNYTLNSNMSHYESKSAKDQKVETNMENKGQEYDQFADYNQDYANYDKPSHVIEYQNQQIYNSDNYTSNYETKNPVGLSSEDACNIPPPQPSSDSGSCHVPASPAADPTVSGGLGSSEAAPARSRFVSRDVRLEDGSGFDTKPVRSNRSRYVPDQYSGERGYYQDQNVEQRHAGAYSDIRLEEGNRGRRGGGRRGYGDGGRGGRGGKRWYDEGGYGDNRRGGRGAAGRGRGRWNENDGRNRGGHRGGSSNNHQVRT